MISRIGDRVAVRGEGAIARRLMSQYPEGAVLIDVDRGVPIVQWPSGARMMVGDGNELITLGDTLEEIYLRR